MVFAWPSFRRLARLAPWVIVAGAAVGCELSRETSGPPADEPVVQLVVLPESTMVDPGQSVQFSAFGRTEDGDSVPVAPTWSATAGTITTAGLFTADATDADGDVTAALPNGGPTRTVRAHKRRVVDVVLTPERTALSPGATQQFQLRGVRNSGDTVSVQTLYAATGGTISSSGVYTAGSEPGEYTVTATDRRTGLADTSAVTITQTPPQPPPQQPAVASVTVSPDSAGVEEGKTVQFAATVKDSAGNVLSGRTVSWTSSDHAVATISANGLATGVKAGSATITATSGGKSGSARLTVTAAAQPPPPPPSSCSTSSTTWANSAFTSQAGSFTVEFTATPNAAAIDGLTGLSAGPAAGYTDLAVIVRFNTAGQIDARNGGAYSAASAIPYAAGTGYRFRLVVNLSTRTYAAYVTPGSGSEVTIGTGYAFRSEQSTVTQLANWASYSSSGTHTVCGFQIVSSSPPAPVASVSVTPDTASIGQGQTVQLAAALKDSEGNTLAGRTVSWATSNASVATVSASGLVTGVAVGTADVTATSEGKSDFARITVTAAPPPPPPPPSGSVVLVGAGDIANCSTSTDEATAKLLDAIEGTVFTAGDNAYPDGTSSNFSQCYEPTWGRHKARTRPSPGNHDYHTSGAAGYFAYYGENAGPAGRGYYSYDLGAWHIISLNSDGTVSKGSAQEQWLRADLAANTKKCTLAYWHHPRFSSGSHGSDDSQQPLWDALYEYNADVIVVGHDHNYERFAPQTPTGAADPVRGIRQFVVGTGGTSLRSIGSGIANSEVRNADTHGVIKFTLHAESYDWEFVPVAGKTFRDSGSGVCH